MPQKAHEQFSDEELANIKAMFDGGKTGNDIAEAFGRPRRTMAKVLKHLGLQRSVKETSKLSVQSPWDDPVIIAKVVAMRNSTSLPEISKTLDIPISSLHRLCKRHNIKLPDNYAELQSTRMVAAWTEEKKQVAADKSLALVTDELRESLSAGTKQLWKSEEYRNKQVASQTEYWNRPENKMRLAQYRADQSGRVSNIQKMLYDMLDDLGIEHTPEFVIGPYNFDCLAGNFLIECQGDYWHTLDKAIRVDKAKQTYVSSYTKYQLRYLWEHEFACPDRVIETLKYWFGLHKMELVPFEFADVFIRPASAADYRPLLSKYHYLPNAGRSGECHGAYIGDDLVAACVFSPPLRQNIDLTAFPAGRVVELSRLCIHPKYQKKNFGSWFVSRCLKGLPDDVVGVISYCDTTFNHSGAIYKSLNFTQDKVIRPDYWYADANGWVMHKKTLYGKASKMSITEADYAEKFGYKKVFGTEKLRFIWKR